MTATAAAAQKETQASSFASIFDVLAFLVSYKVKDFYARVVSALPSREDTRVPMMGVCFEKGHHVFLYNAEWVAKKLDEGRKGFDELRATIAHEAMHVILCHIARQMKLYRNFSSTEEQKRFLERTNIATDMAANDLLIREVNEHSTGGGHAYPHMHNNKKEWILPESAELPAELTYEWYVSLLMDKKQCGQCAVQALKYPPKKGEKPQPCQHGGKGQRGDGLPTTSHGGAHDLWAQMSEELSDEEVEVLVSQIEGDAYEKVKTATEEHKKSRGTVPGHVEQQLEEMLKPPVIPWKKLLHQFVNRCRLSKPLRSMERPRKRWLGMAGPMANLSTVFPGAKRDKTFHLYFAIDTSGSMSEADLLDGLSELQGIQKVDRDIEVTVVEFDTQIHKEYLLRAAGEVDVNLRGRGGTDFNAAFDRAKELGQKGEVDAIIIYTDGYAPAPELQFRPKDVPVLWCLTDGGTHPVPGYGYEIRRPRTRPSYY